MLPKTQRLSFQDVVQIKARGRHLKNQYFSIVVHPNQLLFCRFAVVTSTKISKKAVIRNALRRRIYNQLRNCSLSGCDVIIFPRIEVLKLDHEDLDTQLNSLLSKVSIVSVGV